MTTAADTGASIAPDSPQIRLEGITLGYGDTLVQKDLSFDIRRGDVFVIMGGSGCGKSTVMRCVTGLLEPWAGRVLLQGESLWEQPPAARSMLMRRNGVMYQSGALWSSMTLEENICLPLEQYTDLAPEQMRAIAEYKLALVGLAGYGDYYPSEISGGMRKRVGVARAMALDPDTLFFDEPSAGLDPISARRLDELILELRDSLGTTMVVITHELDSIFTIADDSVFLDAETKTMLATGNPRELREHSPIAQVRTFLNRGEAGAYGSA
ncbi:MAG: ATP-binding cassette domain-containing protein [Thiohalocapsa sp.]|jgi:phospholipid/cholesterol/gamma-HCH transport system ATP-binding protein|uniref:ABC transporter ATP-binding protein n=1 Tax=Thiohalocapsa sp. TaxID=2497641 RepID=UPI0025F0A05F|nr:ATP-binding cassette domain-containing protein [Thiohalocapsa sp.]MCG6940408.1 ATP-binding cassette domain-containing protein [Thiohalocapsa sp.]